MHNYLDKSKIQTFLSGKKIYKSIFFARGVAEVKFLVGQKKLLRRSLYFFPFEQNIILNWAKKTGTHLGRRPN